MANISPEALHALQMAMQNELDTVQIYRNMLKKVQNSKTRDILKQLISEESIHEQRIKDKFLKGGGAIPEPDQQFDLPDRTQLMELELDNLSVLELINLAIQNERISCDFYKTQSERAEDAEVKYIFNWLAEQEEIHIRHLRSEHESHKDYEEVRYPEQDTETEPPSSK